MMVTDWIQMNEISLVW